MISVEEWLRLQVTKVGSRQPFFGILATYLRLEASTDFPIAATDGSRLLYNPDHFERLRAQSAEGSEHAQFIVAHEVLHPALRHLWRRGERDPLIWNAACDFVDNQILVDAGFKMPEGLLLDERFRGMTEEQIYDILVREQTAISQAIADLIENGSPQGNSEGSGGGDKEPSHGTDGNANNGNKLAEIWRERAVTAAAAAKMRGNLPARLARIVDAMTQPPVPWRVVLAEFIQPYSHDLSWRKPERRLISQGIYLPTPDGEQLDRLVIAVDTSGSISKEELSAALGHIRDVLDSYDRVAATVIACDAAVHDVYELATGDKLPNKLGGGGGTRTEPVFDWVAEQNTPPYAVVYFTDGYASYPTAPPDYPVLWVLTPNHQEPPWGRTLVLDK
jgi:predicted metal-dependent peptidase